MGDPRIKEKMGSGHLNKQDICSQGGWSKQRYSLQDSIAYSSRYGLVLLCHIGIEMNFYGNFSVY